MPENVTTQLADDAAEHSLNLLRIDAGMRREVVGMLEELEDDLVSQLGKTDLTAARKEHLEKFLASTKGQISSAYEQIAKIGEENLEKVAKLTTKQTATSIETAITAKGVATLSPEQLTRIAKGPLIEGSPMTDWWNGQSAASQRRFAGAIRQGLLQGEDMAAIQRRVRGTKANGYKDGALSVSKREAEALTRTAVQSVSNQARIDTMLANPDLVKGIQWVATLDGHTTKICMALNGKSWSLPDFKPIGHDKRFPGPVAHWSCRSTQVPKTFSWAELAGKKKGGKALGKPKLTFQQAFEKRLAEQGFDAEEISEITANTKASMDGQVAEKTTHDEWLDRKGDSFAEQALGPSRFALWKSGKLKVQDLTDQNNRPLSVQQLEEAYNDGKPAPETEGTALPRRQQVAAKAAALKQIEDDADAKLKEYVENQKDQAMHAKWAAKVDDELPDATASEKLAWVNMRADEEARATILRAAKRRLVEGKQPTPAQQRVIDGLSKVERENFDDAVAWAKIKRG